MKWKLKKYLLITNIIITVIWNGISENKLNCKINVTEITTPMKVPNNMLVNIITLASNR